MKEKYEVIEAADLELCGNSFSWNDVSFQISNISRIYVKPLPKHCLKSWYWILLLIGIIMTLTAFRLFALGKLVRMMIGSGAGYTVAFAIIGILLILGFIAELSEIKEYNDANWHGLHVEMNSGGIYSFSAPGVDFLRKAMAGILDVVDAYKAGIKIENAQIDFGKQEINIDNAIIKRINNA